MSQSIDFRINDFITEYLDYKGFNDTVGIFLKERKTRQEPIQQLTNGNHIQDTDQEKCQVIKDEMLKYFDDGNREEFFRLWIKHIPSNIIESDPSLKSLEFLLYAHFAIYYIRPNNRTKNEQAGKDNMQEFKTYMESIKGQAISQTSDILPLFALPFVTAPDKHASFQELFSNEWPVQLRKKVLNFFDWIFSNRPLPRLVELLQNGERASHVLTQINNEHEELKNRNRETNKQIKSLSTDYCNLISITMELVETLQQAIVGKTITNEYIDNVCSRLGLERLRESMSHAMESARLGIDDPFAEKLDYDKIKRDVVHVSTSPRQKSLLLQALRWKLTKATTDFKREKMLECYINCDLLGCRTDVEQRTKIVKELLSPSSTSDTRCVKEEWARFINTIASLRKGRNYLAPNESLIVGMQKATIAEQSDTHTKQHLLAALQKLSLRRSVQTIMINENMIKWLLPLLSKSNSLSDYTLEYGVALLMNLCLRTEGRKKCAEVAEQAIAVLASLLSHPNHETRPYVNSSLYSILTLKSVRDKAIQQNLESRLRTLIRTDTANSETKGQLEFLLNLLCKSGDQIIEQSSDNEQDNDDEDQDVMEADLDLADQLKTMDQELNGEDLMLAKYTSQKPAATANIHKSYNNTLYASSINDIKPKSIIDPVLHRPTTPGQFRQSIVAHTVDSLANSLAVGDIFHSQTNGFEQLNGNSSIFAASASMSIKKPLSASIASTITNNNNNNKTKFSKTSSSITRPKQASRASSVDQQKQVTPVLAFAANDELDHSIPTITTPKITPPMKFSFSEPPRSNSSASIRSSTSSILELSNGTLNNQKTKKL
ncbi:unnamed protein product [Rotaria socialis]|uniref:LisH domain-containing protein ARMC9 n=1 Tax=Rotaria socialis TaxID=392032 RepID=A0A819XY37_9BILA|nr:unnamed protein product [Rotaria socialis]CAF4147905.1 unnamed protein product [Rotaria socialis]